MAKANIFIGTSGYTYKHWREAFYPKDVKQKDWLKYYAQYFQSVEINSSFYHLVKDTTYAKWKKETPDDFKFVLKGSRYITHLKRLNPPPDALDNYLLPASFLGEKLSCILWQLPSNFHLNPKRLNGFCELLSDHKIARNVRHAFEFRHPSWFSEEVYRILEANNIALCIAHSEHWPVIIRATADFIYFRFHGSALYSSKYSKLEMKAWAEEAKKFLLNGKDIYAYFNNDAHAFAIENALELKRFLE